MNTRGFSWQHDVPLPHSDLANHPRPCVELQSEFLHLHLETFWSGIKTKALSAVDILKSLRQWALCFAVSRMITLKICQSFQV